jgi:hypothetical protein
MTRRRARSTGDKKSRGKPNARTLTLSSSASDSDKTAPSGTESAAKKSVLRNESQNSPSLISC